jgi:hypothetical protein
MEHPRRAQTCAAMRTDRTHRTSPDECRQARHIGTYALGSLCATERRLSRVQHSFAARGYVPPIRENPDSQMRVLRRSLRTDERPLVHRHVARSREARDGARCDEREHAEGQEDGCASMRNTAPRDDLLGCDETGDHGHPHDAHHPQCEERRHESPTSAIVLLSSAPRGPALPRPGACRSLLCAPQGPARLSPTGCSPRLLFTAERLLHGIDERTPLGRGGCHCQQAAESAQLQGKCGIRAR